MSAKRRTWKLPEGEIIREQIMDFIRSFAAENGYPPSQREIAEGVGRARSAVVIHLDRLQEEGRLRRGTGARTIVLSDE